MDERAEGLHFDFTADNGSFLLVDRTPTLSRDDLNSIEMHMLLHNQIPRLLPIQIEEVDRKVRFLYKIGGKKMLAYRLRREPLTQEQYLRMMLHAVTALADCGSYMLNEECLLLRCDYIFTGSEITDIFFPYVPIQPLGQPSSLEQLKAFSAQCLGSVSSMEGPSIPRVLASLRGDTIRFSELKELLLTLLLERSRDISDENIGALAPVFTLPEADHAPVRREKPSWITSAASNASTLQTEAAAGLVPDRFKPSAPMPPAKLLPYGHGELVQNKASGPVSWFKRIRELKDEVGPTLDTGVLPSKQSDGLKPSDEEMNGRLALKKNVYLGAASLALIAFIWSFYSDASSVVDICVMAGLSGIVGLGITVLLRTRPSWLYGNDTGKTEQAEPEFDEASFGGVVNVWSEFGSLPQTQARTDAPARDMPVEHRPDQVSPFLNTSTVLLDPDSLRSEMEARVHHFWLDITKETGSDKVKLATDSFLIGREDGRVHYPLEEAGVSKHHLELILREGTYCAQDLGSTNGTLLNGERMAPYKLYPLADGDQLFIIRTQFVFKTDQL